MTLFKTLSSHTSEIMLGLFVLSELLALNPAWKSNSVLQLITNILSAIVSKTPYGQYLPGKTKIVEVKPVESMQQTLIAVTPEEQKTTLETPTTQVTITTDKNE